MEKEKNQAPEEPRWPDYKETLLARHPGTGEVQVVSDLRERGNRYEVHTVEPLTKNAPSFFEVAKSGSSRRRAGSGDCGGHARDQGVGNVLAALLPQP